LARNDEQLATQQSVEFAIGFLWIFPPDGPGRVAAAAINYKDEVAAVGGT